MSETTKLRPFGPVHTEVRKVQVSLDALWDEAQVETRAYTGNLVALTTSRYLGRVRDALGGLEGRYAGRQIIGVMDGNALVGVQVSLLPLKNTYVEQVIINATPAQLQGAILPLLRPATLTHIWWAADEAPQTALLTELTEVADQVIVDSLRLDVPPAAHYSLADLGWSRSAGWREALAQLFDAPDAVAQLPRVTKLSVAYAGDKALPARLFAGWIAGVLGWSSLEQVTFSASGGQRDNGDLTRVELSGEGVLFCLEAGASDLCTIVAEYGGHRRESQIVIPRMTLSEGLERIIARPDRGTNFERAWQLAQASLPRAGAA